MKKLLSFMLITVIITFTFSIFASAASTSTVLTRTSGKILCSVYLDDIPEGSVIVISSFKDGRFSSSLFRSSAEAVIESFYVDGDTNEIKVFVFRDMTSISPVTKGESIEVMLDGITDTDWSEWI